MLFLSTYVNRIDKKGRVSVPAGFRNALTQQSFAGIVAYGSFVHPCIEACSMAYMERLHQQMDRLDPFSEERDAFVTAILGGSTQLPFDADGRIILPHSLLEIAELKEEALFVGKGHTFEIWHPERFAAYAHSARELARSKRTHLRVLPDARHPPYGEER